MLPEGEEASEPAQLSERFLRERLFDSFDIISEGILSCTLDFSVDVGTSESIQVCERRSRKGLLSGDLVKVPSVTCLISPAGRNPSFVPLGIQAYSKMLTNDSYSEKFVVFNYPIQNPKPSFAILSLANLFVFLILILYNGRLKRDTQKKFVHILKLLINTWNKI